MTIEHPYKVLIGIEKMIKDEIKKSLDNNDTNKIVSTTKYLEKTKKLRDRYEDIMIQIEGFNKNYLNKDKNISINNNLSPIRAGKERRNKFVNIIKSKGFIIKHIKGIKYRINNKIVAIPTATMINNGWFLGIRDEDYDNVILVCEMDNGEINGIIPELDFFQKHFNLFSRDTKGQIKFNLGYSNNNIQWIIPNSDLINVNSYVNNFNNL